MQVRGEEAESDDGREDVLCVLDGGVKPFLVAAGWVAEEDSRADAGNELQKDLLDLDFDPSI